MNKIYKLLFLLSVVAILFTACSPEDFALGSQDVKSTDLVEGIAYKIEHDAANPNIIHLTSLMGSEYTPLWNHPQGRSQEQKVTLKMPFAGTYKVQFGVETRGGVVYGDTVTFKVDNMYAEFVSDPMWTLVSGGAGKEKTWYLDLDAQGVSRYFKAPMYFFTGTYTWDNLHYPTGESYLDGNTNESFTWDPKKAITPNLTDGVATWYWLADWAGNGWMCAKADFGTMTFNLKGGANVIVDQEAYDSNLGKNVGTYMLDTKTHSIKFTSVSPLHVTERDGDVKAATEFRILYLTEDAMQIITVPGGEVFNYISKDYKDNWAPVVLAYAEPIKTTFKQSDLVGTWKYNLVNQSWIGWEVEGSNKGGALLNNWPTRTAMLTDLVSWGGSASTITNADNNLYVFNADGTCTLNGVSNTYTVANGTITFGTALTGTEWNLIYITFTGKTVNVLNVTSRDGKPYSSSGIWLGQRNGTKEEDSSVQLVKQY